MNETDELGAATQGLAEFFTELGFPAEKAEGMAEWLASYDEEFE